MSLDSSKVNPVWTGLGCTHSLWWNGPHFISQPEVKSGAISLPSDLVQLEGMREVAAPGVQGPASWPGNYSSRLL